MRYQSGPVAIRFARTAPVSINARHTNPALSPPLTCSGIRLMSTSWALLYGYLLIARSLTRRLSPCAAGTCPKLVSLSGSSSPPARPSTRSQIYHRTGPSSSQAYCRRMEVCRRSAWRRTSRSGRGASTRRVISPQPAAARPRLTLITIWRRPPACTPLAGPTCPQAQCGCSAASTSAS